MPLTANSKLGPFEIVAPLGAGGMGEVYRARDTRLDRAVAVKVLPALFSADPERLRRFEQEARAAGALNHPNILAIYDVGSHDGAPYLVTELLEGETLRERLRSGPLPLRKALDVAMQMARGVAAAHEKGIVHRDLKPANIFLTDDGRVKILDFGLAKLAERDGPNQSESQSPTRTVDHGPHTEAGVLLGTAGYMSPEQVRGKPADARSDIFALGTVLYEMLSGQRAFEKDSSADTMAAILKEDPPELSGEGRKIPPAVERVVRHCLEKNPSERFQSARDMAFDLESLSQPSALTGSRAIVAPAPSRRRLWFALVGTAGLILACVGTFLVTRQFSQRPPPDFQSLTFRRGRVASARFAPDGETVLYSAAWQGAPVNVFSTRADSPESRSVGLPDDSEILSVSSQGQMAILLGAKQVGAFEIAGTLAQASLSGGAPRELLKDIEWADWAPDGKTLAVARFIPGGETLEFPIGKVLYKTTGWVGDVRFSPRGDQIAFIDHPNFNDNGGAVAVVDLSGKKKVLTGTWASTEGLAWSPSGNEIWFTASENGSDQNVFGVTLAGKQRLIERAPGSVRLLDVSKEGGALLDLELNRLSMIVGGFPGANEERDLSWLDWSLPADLSADGQTVLFTEAGQGGGPSYSVYLRKTDGSPAIRLGDGLAGSLSPDGQWAIAGRLQDHRVQTYLLPTGAGEPRQLTNDSIDPGGGVSWFPNGKQIAFSGAEPGHGSRVYVQSIDGGPPHPISPEGVVAFPKSVRRDGKFVLGRTKERKWMLYPVDGGKPQPVPGIEPGEIAIGWSADGQSVFVANPAPPVRISRVNVTTSRRDLVREITPSDPAGVTQLFVNAITPDGKFYAYDCGHMLSSLYLVRGMK